MYFTKMYSYFLQCTDIAPADFTTPPKPLAEPITAGIRKKATRHFLPFFIFKE